MVSLDADSSIERRKTSGLFMLFETGRSPHCLPRTGLLSVLHYQQQPPKRYRINGTQINQLNLSCCCRRL